MLCNEYPGSSKFPHKTKDISYKHTCPELQWGLDCQRARMTISYSHKEGKTTSQYYLQPQLQVGKASRFGTFFKLLLSWRGSIYKLIYAE